VLKHFAIVEHFLLCTKGVLFARAALSQSMKPIDAIGNLNWISFLRCSIMNLSPLFSSTDRLSPLPKRAFFLPAYRRQHSILVVLQKTFATKLTGVAIQQQ
jgi:hypothetical protein